MINFCAWLTWKSLFGAQMTKGEIDNRKNFDKVGFDSHLISYFRSKVILKLFKASLVLKIFPHFPHSFGTRDVCLDQNNQALVSPCFTFYPAQGALWPAVPVLWLANWPQARPLIGRLDMFWHGEEYQSTYFQLRPHRTSTSSFIHKINNILNSQHTFHTFWTFKKELGSVHEMRRFLLFQHLLDL